jgi:hypothetical protein
MKFFFIDGYGMSNGLGKVQLWIVPSYRVGLDSHIHLPWTASTINRWLRIPPPLDYSRGKFYYPNCLHFTTYFIAAAKTHGVTRFLL